MLGGGWEWHTALAPCILDAEKLSTYLAVQLVNACELIL